MTTPGAAPQRGGAPSAHHTSGAGRCSSDAARAQLAQRRPLWPTPCLHARLFTYLACPPHPNPILTAGSARRQVLATICASVAAHLADHAPHRSASHAARRLLSVLAGRDVAPAAPAAAATNGAAYVHTAQVRPRTENDPRALATALVRVWLSRPRHARLTWSARVRVSPVATMHASCWGPASSPAAMP